MILSLTNSHEVEALRQQAAQKMQAEQGANWAEQFKPGTMGCHELLDRTHLLAEFVEQQLQEHPACVANPEWYALAERAASALHELYQQVGSDHLAKG
jgi:hypothetical protein